MTVSARRDSSRRGFSLIELVMVLVTVATISAIAMPRYAGAIAHYRLESAVQRIVADVALAKSRANFSSTPVTVSFDPSTSTYQIQGMPDPNGRTGTYTVNLAADPYRVTLMSASFGNGNQLTFDGYGTPSQGGSVSIAGSGRVRTIAVDSSSGSTSVQ